MKTTPAILCLGLALAMGPLQPAEAKNTLRWASQGDALTFDPHAQNEGPTNTANSQVYEPLVQRNARMEKEPGLAVSWRLVDPKTWEFKLRRGVKFHDGAAFTAEDVVFSLQRAKAPTSDFKGYITSVAEVRAVDDLTVHISTTGPNPILPDQLTGVLIMDKGWAEKHGVTKPQDYKQKEETYAVRNANGTGPFKLQLREPGVRTLMVRNPDWWGLPTDRHNVDEILYTPLANPATRVAAMLSGRFERKVAARKATPQRPPMGFSPSVWRWSSQTIAGRSGRPSSSAATIVTRWVVRATPTTASGRAAGSAQRRRQASPMAAHQTSGSCSAQPGRGETYGSIGTRPDATSVPRGSNRRARTLCVPTSSASS